jgi:hypothetical protein
MDEDMATWTRIWQHGRGHGNMDEDMTWTRTWRHGRGHGDMDEDMETWTRTWRHGDMDVETWRHEKWRYEDMDTWRHGYAEIWRHGIKILRNSEFYEKKKTIKQKKENGQRRFSFIHLPFAHRATGRMSFAHLLTKNKQELSICKRTKWTKRICPSIAKPHR